MIGNKNYDVLLGKPIEAILPSQTSAENLSDEDLEREFDLLQSGQNPAQVGAYSTTNGFFGMFLNQLFPKQ